MFAKIVVLCCVVAVSQAGLLPVAVHYSSAAAVSSQSIVRHDESRVAAPVAKLAIAAPFYQAAAPVYHAPAPIVYHAPAPVFYKALAPIAYDAAQVVAKENAAHEEEYAHPKYEFSYSVNDYHTGDHKQQQESRDGDVVKGSYSFHEADGSIRTVDYSADDHSGFNAVVNNSAPTAAPVVKDAPAVVKAAPVLPESKVYEFLAPHYYHY